MKLFNKATATHKWTENTVTTWYTQLFLYKRYKGQWWVFSDKTGWRPSGNDKAWFKEEKKLGYFVKLTKEQRGQLAKAN